MISPRSNGRAKNRSRNKGQSRTRRGFLPGSTAFPEVLESRVTPVSSVAWSGLSALNDDWSSIRNWFHHDAPAPGVNLEFPAFASAFASNNDLAAGTEFGSMRLDSASYVITGNAVALSGGVTTTYTAGVGTLNLPISLSAGQDFEIAGAGTLDINGVLSGTGAVRKTGAGTLNLDGANTYTATTEVTAGTLQLGGSLAGDAAVSGGTLLVAGSVAGGAEVSGGFLVVNGTVSGNVAAGNNSTVSGIGEISGDMRSSTETTTGNYTLAPAGTSAVGTLTIGGELALGTNSYLHINITGAASSDKIVVADDVDLTGANLSVALGYAPSVGAKFTIVEAGAGATITGTFNGLAEGGTFASGGAVFEISYAGGDGNDIELEVLSYGSSNFPNIGWNSNGGNWSVGSNWYEGAPPLAGGFYNFYPNANASSNNDFPAGRDVGVISVFKDGSQTISGNSIDLLSGISTGGIFTNDFVSVTISLPMVMQNTSAFANVSETSNTGSSLTISGAISELVGGTDFRKDGAGVLTLSGTNTYTGETIINAGTLTVSGTVAGDVVGAGTGTLLQGNGTIGGSIVAGPETEGFLISPSGAGATGILSISGGLDFSQETTYRVNIAGTTAGTQYDQLQVANPDSSSIDLASATLDIAFSTTPSISSTYTIINNTGTQAIIGTFAGIAEGEIFFLNGYKLQMTYTGGTGSNDAVLTVLDTPRTWTGSSGSTWNTAGSWSPSSAPPANSTLVFTPSAANKTNNNDLTANTAFDNLTIQSSGYTLAGNAIDLTYGVQATYASGTSTVALPITLASSRPAFEVAAGGTLVISGAIGESTSGYAPNKTGAGILTLSGTNTYTGATEVSEGTLLVNGTVNAVNATADGTTVGGSGTVDDLSLSFMGSDYAATLAPGGVGTVGGFTVGSSLTMNNRSTLAIDLNGAAAGTGYDQLVAPIDGTIEGVDLAVALGYTPAVGATFTIVDNTAGGPISARFLDLPEGAEFQVGNTVFRITYAGGDGNNIVLTAISVAYTWDGSSGANWNDAANWVENQVPSAGSSLVFPDSASNKTNSNNLAAGTIFADITFAGAGYTISGNAIGLAGQISATAIGSSTFGLATQLQSFVTVIDLAEGARLSHTGAITEAGSGYALSKLGEGILTLGGASTYSGFTNLFGGTILFTGALDTAGAVAFNGTTVGGTGTIDGDVYSGGDGDAAFTIAPGLQATSGKLTVGGLTLNAEATYAADLDGSTAGSGYDQISTAGAINLLSPILDIELTYAPTPGTQFVIIENTGNGAVSGTFAGLPEGAVFLVDGNVFSITYIGGDGANDVILNYWGVGKIWDGGDIDDNLWTSGDNWVGDVAPSAGDNLFFPTGAARLSNTNNFANNTDFGDITITGAGYDLAGNIIDLTGDLLATYATGTSTISAGLKLLTSRSADVATGGTLTLAGEITSDNLTQDLTKTGAGTLRFAGSVHNQFDDIFANEGTVALAMTNGSNVNSSDLFIGDNTTSATVVFEADRQLWAGANVTVNEGSTLDLGSFDADISNLYLQGATVQIDSGGLLEIFIGVFSTATTNNATSSITGAGSLGQSGSQFAFNVADDADVDIDLSVGVEVTGSVAIEKDGAGTLELSGANTFVSTLNINAGILLATSDGALGVASTSSTQVDSGAALHFSGPDLAVSEQIYIAGTGVDGSGALRVLSGTTTLASGGNQAIYVASAATIGADDGATLDITGEIDTGFGSATPLTITNGATGRTILGANNGDFGGSITLTEGFLRATQSDSFGCSGASSTVTIEDGGTLELSGGITTPDTKSFVLSGAPATGSAKIVNLDGDNTLSGGISYTDEQTFAIADGTTLTLSGAIGNGASGDALNFDGNASGRAILAGDNTYNGDTNVLGGYLRATHDNAFGDPASSLYITASAGASIELSGGLTIPDTKRFVLDGLAATGASKLIIVDGYNTIAGNIALSSNNQSISVAPESTLFLNGEISGSVDLDKNGLGDLFLTGDSPFTGQFNLYEGAAYVNGSLAAASLVFVDGLLGGDGTVSNVSVSGIGTLAPGDSESLTATLTTGNITLVSGSTYAVQLDGTDDHDQLDSSGEIDLTGSTLSVGLLTVPAIGDEFMIIVNGVMGEPVTGTFAGLAEGSTFTVGNVTFAITYEGGDGNDVVLTATDVVYIWDGGGEATADWSDAMNWVGDLTPTPGARLVFPDGADRPENFNDLGDGFAVHSIEIAGAGYSISGNSIELGRSILVDAPGTTSLGFDIATQNGAEIDVDVAADATLAIAGDFTGTGQLDMNGPGRAVLAEAASFASIDILGGTLIINGSASGGGGITVDGTLGGSGSVPGVTVNAGGTIAPGDIEDNATLTTGSVSLNAEATYAVDLNGIDDYDRIFASGAVDLNNAFLTISLDATPRHGEEYMIVEVFSDNLLTGTFAGLPEGSTITLGNVVFTISYEGGDGNDVVLTADVTYTWDGGDADDNLWTSPDNWVGDVAPTPGARLVFPDGAQRKANLNNFAAGFDVHEIVVQASDYTLSGNGIDIFGGIEATYASGTSRINLPILFFGNEVEIGAGTLALGGSLTEEGPTNVTFSGPGTVILDGATSNSLYSITTDGATLLLGKTAGVEAANHLYIGPGATLRYLADDQVRDTAYVQLQTGAYLDFGGFSDQFYVMTLIGATADIPEGSTFTLGYYIWSRESDRVSRINGPGTIDLNGASYAYIYTDDTPDLDIDLVLGAVLTNGGVDYTYDYSMGTVAVTAANTYEGITYIEGNVRLENAQGLGAPGNADDGYTDIYAYYGGQLILAVDDLVLGEFFYLAGQDSSPNPLLWNVAENATLTGEIALYDNDDGTTAKIGTADGTTLTLSGVISEYEDSMYLVIANGATGRVVLAGDNTFTGAVDLASGYLRLAHDNALGDPASDYSLDVDDGATLELTGGITLPATKRPWLYGAPVAGAPKLANLSGDNTILAGVYFFNDIVIDVAAGSALNLPGGLDDDSVGAGITKTGAGTLALASSDYTGSTTVAAGTLALLGSLHASSYTYVLDGATLAGTGPASRTEVLAGGAIAPGVGGPGILAVGSLDLALDALYELDLLGTTPGTGYDQLATLSATISGATLQLNLGDFVAQNGQTFTIVANNPEFPVAGTFAGLPEGAIFQVGGQPFQITYSGGPGSDVVLTSLAMSISPGTLVPAAAGSTYSQQLAAAGGSGAGYTYSATGLPAGLAIDPATGLISGTPTAAGTTSFTVTVVDSIGSTTTQAYSITINPALTISPAVLPAPALGIPYSQQLTPGGGSAEGYTFSATGLPPGLAIDPETGLISGTTTDPTPVTATVTLTDSTGASTQRQYNFSPAAAASATALATSANPITFGQPLTLTATITSPAQGAPVATGTVEFYNGSTLLGSATLGEGGVAVLNLPALGAGSYSITAVYLGNDLLQPSTSAPVAQVVARADASTALASSTATPVAGTPFTLTATVTPALAGATVSFLDGGTLLGTATTDAEGVATFVAANLAPGNHSLSARFEGTANYAPDTSETIELTVARSQSQAGALVSSTPEAFFGQNVTFTATFSANSVNGLPMTGDVDFFDAETGEYLGRGQMQPFVDVVSLSSFRAAAAAPQVRGFAVLNTTALAVGQHVIRAVYLGDANYAPVVTETPVDVQVDPATTRTILAVATTAAGTTLTATVVVTSPGNPPIDGSVSFFAGDTPLGTAPVANGVASLLVTDLPPGVTVFRAVYSGDGSVESSSESVVASTDGPQVVSLSRLGYHATPTQIVLGFNLPLDPARAQNVANYILTDSRGRAIPIASASYDPLALTVTLRPRANLAIRQAYTLTVVGTAPNGLTGANGVPLDGSGTDQPGTDFTAAITWRSLSASPATPAMTFADGQAHQFSGPFGAHINAILRATKARAARMAGLPRRGR